MLKKLLVLTLAAMLLLTVTMPALAATVLPSPSKVLVNEVEKSFEAYNIDGNNYFKLRDLAFVLNKTPKNFQVAYDESTRNIMLASKTAYTPVGGEMEGAATEAKAAGAAPTTSTIYKDGVPLNFTVYNIGGNNFFKLRDLMKVFDIGVGYDKETKLITLNTNLGYEDEDESGAVEGDESNDVSGGVSGTEPLGKYTVVSMTDGEGNDWLEFFKMLSELVGEGDEFDPNDMYIEFLSGGKFVMSIDMDSPGEGTYTVDGNTITLSAEDQEIKGTLDGNKFTIVTGEGSESVTMVFEKK